MFKHKAIKIDGHAAPAGGSSKSSSESFDDLPSIAGYDEILNGTFKSFKDLSGKIGGEVKAIVSIWAFFEYSCFSYISLNFYYKVDLVDNVCKYQRSFLIEAARSTQPSQVNININKIEKEKIFLKN